MCLIGVFLFHLSGQIFLSCIRVPFQGQSDNMLNKQVKQFAFGIRSAPRSSGPLNMDIDIISSLLQAPEITRVSVRQCLQMARQVVIKS